MADLLSKVVADSNVQSIYGIIRNGHYELPRENTQPSQENAQPSQETHRPTNNIFNQNLDSGTTSPPDTHETNNKVKHPADSCLPPGSVNTSAPKNSQFHNTNKLEPKSNISSTHIDDANNQELNQVIEEDRTANSNTKKNDSSKTTNIETINIETLNIPRGKSAQLRNTIENKNTDSLIGNSNSNNNHETSLSEAGALNQRTAKNGITPKNETKIIQSFNLKIGVDPLEIKNKTEDQTPERKLFISDKVEIEKNTPDATRQPVYFVNQEIEKEQSTQQTLTQKPPSSNYPNNKKNNNQPAKAEVKINSIDIFISPPNNNSGPANTKPQTPGLSLSANYLKRL